MKRAENRFALPSSRADHVLLRRTHHGFAVFLSPRNGGAVPAKLADMYEQRVAIRYNGLNEPATCQSSIASHTLH